MGQTRCQSWPAAQQQYSQLVQNRGSSLAQTNHEQQRADTPRQQLSRAEEVVLHRLRLALDLEELRDGFEERPCGALYSYGNTHPLTPLPAFLSRYRGAGTVRRPGGKRPPSYGQFRKICLVLEGARLRPTPTMNTKEREWPQPAH
ncbi:hypothetical protein GWK47_028925 [Chionoecetes opilio]|uniref:Uncharacterized protein n=1 Tax=Chionoecetes opilio TaxID=41210 RepID=A0A8J4YYD0_CHIOP|nr:hypothetical protein GWK47_028925 [Chionoecetes opilio]